MPTPDELRSSIAEARELLRTSIAATGDRWESTASDDWTPRKAAEHAIAAEVYFATEVCAACGYPGLDPWPASYPTAADALQGLADASAKADGRLKYVTETDLPHKHKTWGDVSGIMQYNATHLREHAAQIAGA
jgi:hypothetical protein